MKPQTCENWNTGEVGCPCFEYQNCQVQWGSEIQPYQVRTFWRSNFKWSGISYGHSKPDYLKSLHFCQDFKWFLTKWHPFVWISNGWASGFQIPFKIQSICNPAFFWPFEIKTYPYLRSPLYLDTRCNLNLIHFHDLIWNIAADVDVIPEMGLQMSQNPRPATCVFCDL